jgi:hypothetical protein
VRLGQVSFKELNRLPTVGAGRGSRSGCCVRQLRPGDAGGREHTTSGAGTFRAPLLADIRA